MNREWTGTLNWVLREHCISIKEEGGWGAEKRSQISRSDMMLRYFLWCLPPTLWHSGETHPNHVGLATWQGEMEKCSLTGCWWWQSLSEEFKKNIRNRKNNFFQKRQHRYVTTWRHWVPCLHASRGSYARNIPISTTFKPFMSVFNGSSPGQGLLVMSYTLEWNPC